MVIRREDSGVSSLKKSRGVAVAPARICGCAYTRVHVDRFSNFSKGLNEGILGMAKRIPRGVQGQNPCTGSRVLCSSEAKGNFTYLF